jgi:hypothetical protein
LAAPVEIGSGRVGETRLGRAVVQSEPWEVERLGGDEYDFDHSWENASREAAELLGKLADHGGVWEVIKTAASHRLDDKCRSIVRSGDSRLRSSALANTSATTRASADFARSLQDTYRMTV